jgi:hypothetical protein
MTEDTFIDRASRFQGTCNCVSLKCDSEDQYLSSSKCDCCEALPGYRHKVVGYNPENQEVVELGEICDDCLYYFCYGDIPHADLA